MKIENEEQLKAAHARLDEMVFGSDGSPDDPEWNIIIGAIYQYEKRDNQTREDILQQALDEAILGLHGMNKDFPNETWESRQAYLDATIAGINETLSLLK